MVTLKYAQTRNMQFFQAVQKIGTTPLHGDLKGIVHRTIKQLSRAKGDITKEFQRDIAEVFGKRDEAGNLIRPPGEDSGFEPMEDKQEEFDKAIEAFDERTFQIDLRPFTLQQLDKMMLSAQDLEALGALYAGNAEDEEEKPSSDNVASIR